MSHEHKVIQKRNSVKSEILEKCNKQLEKFRKCLVEKESIQQKFHLLNHASGTKKCVDN